MSKNHHGRTFNEILVNSIDESLTVLGENVKTSIYINLEQAFKISRQTIPNDIDSFLNALERIFGSGAKHLELLIMENLHEKISHERTDEDPKGLTPDLTFRKYVELARLCYEDAEKGKTTELEVTLNDGQKKYCCE